MSDPVTSDFQFVFAKGGYTYGSRVRILTDTPITRATVGESAALGRSYQGEGVATERRLELAGTIQAASQSDLRAAVDEFMRYHQPGPVDKIVVLGNRWLWGTVDGPIPHPITAFREWRWEAQILCGDPYYYENDLQTVTFDIAGNTPSDFAGLGNAAATPILSFSVSAISSPGTSYLQISNGSPNLADLGRTQVFKFFPRDTGDYEAHMGPNCTNDAKTNRNKGDQVVHASVAGVNRYRRGQAITIFPDSATDNRLTLTLSGVTLSAAPTLTWYPRYL